MNILSEFLSNTPGVTDMINFGIALMGKISIRNICPKYNVSHTQNGILKVEIKENINVKVTEIEGSYYAEQYFRTVFSAML